ncbi:unnamed protein product [Ectocarpus sp. CCAP 1310/34]|nr:unnamed protein product [Ectocarpus sp. CCAP 1310/34]
MALGHHIEPVISLLLAADNDPSLSTLGDLAQQAPDVLGAASDLADSAQASVGESLGAIGNVWDSIVDTVTSAKGQVDDLSANALSPFQRLGEDISNKLNGQLDSLRLGAQGAVGEAQTQFGQSVAENIANPVQEGLGQVFSKFGTSPEELLKEEQTLTNGVHQAIKAVERVAPPSTLFYAENAAVLPLWVGMVVWPEEPLTKKIMNSYGPLILAALIYMWLTYECFQNPVSLQGFASGITNLGGLTKGFGEEVSVATAWSHFLAEDLFIGRWVYLDGQRNKIFTKHSLVLCYLFGPAGFLSHLFTRGVTSVVKPGVRDIMQLQPTKPSPKTPPSGSPSSTLGGEAKELITKAKREAEEILQQARSTGAAQAASLLEEAETEALLILKGAEVEKEALLLRAKKTEPNTEAETGPTGSEAKARSEAKAGSEARTESAKIEPKTL